MVRYGWQSYWHLRSQRCELRVGLDRQHFPGVALGAVMADITTSCILHTLHGFPHVSIENIRQNTTIMAIP